MRNVRNAGRAVSNRGDDPDQTSGVASDGNVAHGRNACNQRNLSPTWVPFLIQAGFVRFIWCTVGNLRAPEGHEHMTASRLNRNPLWVEGRSSSVLVGDGVVVSVAFLRIPG